SSSTGETRTAEGLAIASDDYGSLRLRLFDIRAQLGFDISQWCDSHYLNSFPAINSRLRSFVPVARMFTAFCFSSISKKTRKRLSGPNLDSQLAANGAGALEGLSIPRL